MLVNFSILAYFIFSLFCAVVNQAEGIVPES